MAQGGSSPQRSSIGVTRAVLCVLIPPNSLPQRVLPMGLLGGRARGPLLAPGSHFLAGSRSRRQFAHGAAACPGQEPLLVKLPGWAQLPTPNRLGTPPRLPCPRVSLPGWRQGSSPLPVTPTCQSTPQVAGPPTLPGEAWPVGGKDMRPHLASLGTPCFGGPPQPLPPVCASSTSSPHLFFPRPHPSHQAPSSLRPHFSVKWG